MTNENIRILLVEDDLVDRMAVERMVKREGLPYELVTTETVSEAITHLQGNGFDLALIDHNLPDGTGLEVQEGAGDTPCIFISGVADRTVAMQAMKAGAYDYLIKDPELDYLELLPSVIQSTLKRRREQNQIRRQQHIIDRLSEIVLLLDDFGEVIFANAAVEGMLGYTQEEVHGSAWWQLMFPDARERDEQCLSFVTKLSSEDFSRGYDLELTTKDGSKIWTTWVGSHSAEGNLICVGRNITERVKAEGALRDAHDELEQRVDERTAQLDRLNAALRDEIAERKLAEVGLRRREKQLAEAQRLAHMGSWERDVLRDKSTWSDESYRIYGYEPGGPYPDNYAAFMNIVHPQDRPRLQNHTEEVLVQKEPFSIEYRIVRPDNTIRHIHDRGEVITDTTGRPIQIVGSTLDITERVQAEQALRVSEERYRLVVDNANEAIVVAQDGVLKFTNPRATEITRYEQEELDGFSFIELVHPDDRGLVADRYMRRMRGEDMPSSYEFRIVDQEGIIKWVHINAIMISWEGKPATLNFLNDITERVRAEKLLRSLNQAALAMGTALTPEEIFAAVSDQLETLGFSCAIFFTDENCSVLFPQYLSFGEKAIKVAEKLTGLKVDDYSFPIEPFDVYSDVIYKRRTIFLEDMEDITQKLLPKPVKRFARQLTNILKINKVISSPLIVEDQVIGLLSVLSADLTAEDTGAFTAFAHQVANALRKAQLYEQAQAEIVERVQKEAALRASEERFRSLSASSPVGIFQTDESGSATYINKAMLSILVRKREECLGFGWRAFVHPQDRDVVVKGVSKKVRKGRKFKGKNRILTPNGEVRWVSVRSVPMHAPSGEVVGRVGTMIDISEQVQAEDELHRLNEELLAEKGKLEDIVTGIGAGLSLLDSETNIIWANEVLQDWFGPIEKIEGKKCYHLYDLENPQTECSALSTLRSGHTEQGEAFAYDIRGERKYFQLTTAPLKDEGGKIVQIVELTQDITKRKLYEEQIKASLKEKEVLIQEIHHRVKNNLQVISSLLELQSERVKDTHALRVFQDSQVRVRSMALVHEQLYQSQHLTTIDADLYIQDLVSYLFTSYSGMAEPIRLYMDIDDILLDIDIAIPCGLMISELVSNAIKHAFPQKRDSEGEIKIEFLKSGDRYELVVRDNGIGLPADLELDDVSSLGLQLVTLLVRQLNGTIDVQRDGGTEFKISFPQER